MTSRRGRLAAGTGVTVGATLLMGGTAQAVSTFQVNSLEDPIDAGKTTLHDAIVQANSDPDASVITFASGLSGSIDLATDLPMINWATKIDGPGASELTVSGGPPNGIFHAVGLGGTGLEISGLTLADGFADSGGKGGAINVGGGSPVSIADTVFTLNKAAEGGAIYALNGTLDVRRSTFLGNTATGGEGGGAISSYGAAVTLSDSTVSGNNAPAGAGIVLTTSGGGFGSLSIQSSTVSGNDATSCCGGILTSTPNTTQIRSSTISGNTVSDGPSGGMYVEGPLTVVGSTISGNDADDAGGGIFASLSYDPAVQDSIVAGNTAPYGPDVTGVFLSQFSLIGTVSGATVHEQVPGSNLIGADPQLLPLGQHGGPTATMPPAATSPAIDKGSALGLGADQRGLARTFDAPTIPGATAAGADGTDIGAVELQASEVPPAPAAAPPAATKKKKCKKKKHKRSAESAKKKGCKKKHKKRK